MLANVAELGEVASDVIKHTVKNYLDTVLVQRVADLLEVLIRAETAVDSLVIDGVVTMRYALKYGTKIDSVTAELLDMRDIVNELQELVRRFTRLIVLTGTAEISDGIDVIKYRAFIPFHNITSFSSFTFIPY